MMKWAEICPSSEYHETDRYTFLSEYLKKNGFDNELHFFDITPDNLVRGINEARVQFDQLRIHPDYGSLIVKSLESVPAEIIKIGAADAFKKEHNLWWLRSYLTKAFHIFMSQKQYSLDIDSSALIVGTGASAKAFASGLIKMGFKSVNVSSIFDEQGIEFIQELKSTYFGVKFEFIPQSRLVTLPGVHGVLVNTTPIHNNNDLIEELNYFNFLHKEGLVLDCNLFPLTSELTSGAENIGATVVQGYEIITLADIIWAQEVFNTPLNLKDYQQQFFENFKNKLPEMTESLS